MKSYTCGTKKRWDDGSRFSAVYQCNSCATDSDVDLSKTELVFRLGRRDGTDDGSA